MKVNVFILSHYIERVQNVYQSVENLLAGSVKPDKIIILNDNPDIEIHHEGIDLLNFSCGVPAFTRFCLATCFDSDRTLFIDDDLAVGPKTLENFIRYSTKYPEALLGLEGNVLNKQSDSYYTDGQTVDRGHKLTEVDIIIRTYFVTQQSLAQAIYTRELFKEQLPEKSIDDVILCMSNKYQYSGKNIVIPVDKESDVIELNPWGTGQCTNPEHYINRNLACSILQ